MTIAAAVATMIAIQFTRPSSNARYVRAQAKAEAQASRPRGRTRRTPHRIAREVGAPRSLPGDTGPGRSREAYRQGEGCSPSRGRRRRNADPGRYRPGDAQIDTARCAPARGRG